MTLITRHNSVFRVGAIRSDRPSSAACVAEVRHGMAHSTPHSGLKLQ